MIRWLLSPIILVSVGLAAGLITLQYYLTDGGSERRALILLPIGCAIAACGLTFALLGLERRPITSLKDHPRHMWLIYPFWLFAVPGAFSGSHVSVLYDFPFAALSGVMIGNFVVIAFKVRRSA